MTVVIRRGFAVGLFGRRRTSGQGLDREYRDYHGYVHASWAWLFVALLAGSYIPFNDGAKLRPAVVSRRRHGGDMGKKKRDEKESRRRDKDAREEAAPRDDARGPEGGDRDPGQKKMSDEEQERRFQARISDPTKHWKLSPMDLQSRARWVDYSRAKDEMFTHTDIKQAPWWVVNADDKRLARLNCIAHLLKQMPYQEVEREKVKIPPRQEKEGYVRPPLKDQNFVPDVY